MKDRIIASHGENEWNKFFHFLDLSYLRNFFYVQQLHQRDVSVFEPHCHVKIIQLVCEMWDVYHVQTDILAETGLE